MLCTYSGHDKEPRKLKNRSKMLFLVCSLRQRKCTVCELTGAMCVLLWHISRRDILNSQNMKSIGP
jgi:hypothetical protein